MCAHAYIHAMPGRFVLCIYLRVYMCADACTHTSTCPYAHMRCQGVSSVWAVAPRPSRLRVTPAHLERIWRDSLEAVSQEQTKPGANQAVPLAKGNVAMRCQRHHVSCKQVGREKQLHTVRAWRRRSSATTYDVIILQTLRHTHQKLCCRLFWCTRGHIFDCYV